MSTPLRTSTSLWLQLILFAGASLVGASAANSEVSRQYSNKIFIRTTIKASNEGFISCGANGLVMRVNTLGIPVWARRLALGPSFYAEMLSIAAGANRTVVAVGYRFNRTTGDSDAVVWKLSEDGRTVWKKLIASQHFERLNSIHTTSDGNMIAVGEKGGNGWVLKISPVGIILWAKLLGASGMDSLRHSIEIEGKYVVIGSTDIGSPGQSMLVAGLSRSGDVLWKKLYSGDPMNAIEGVSVLGVGSGKVMLTGSYGTKALIVCITRSGTISWQKTLTSHLSLQQNITSTVFAGDGMLLVGETLSSQTGWDGWLLKMSVRNVSIA